MQLIEGTTLGRYSLKHLIGRGGMAQVYLAEDSLLHREVAIKVVHQSRSEDLLRFQLEAETVGRLEHEHILPVFDYGQEDSWHYLVIPYMSHGTLSQRLQVHGALSLEQTGQILEQVASALQYAHDRGILHRDIKSSNIFLRDETYAYLADFGIARSLDESRELTQTGVVLGTPEYMAPELLEKPASKSSDIYALGIVLYYMLVGRLPFTAPTSLAIFQKQLHELPPDPALRNPALPRAVADAAIAALVKDPKQRFQSPLALANAYRQALLSQPEPILIRTTSAFASDTTIAVANTPYIPDQSLTQAATLARRVPGLQSPGLHSSSKRRLRPLLLATLGTSLLLLVLFVALIVQAISRHGTNSTTIQQPPAITATVTTQPTATLELTSCTVNDPSGTLDTRAICQAAQLLHSSLEVDLTQNTSPNQNDAYEQVNTGTIVISITITRKHGHNQPQVSIQRGSNVPLSDPQSRNASEAFYQALQENGDYTAATIAVIKNLQLEGA